ncbi:MAG: acetyl-CoA carboxylase, carboxyltransferase subunit beta [Kiritimatiellae bacterium]|nr:acetyl-CoA carboxylase, carboxyltransferase subunit beta [Kiritimatiellia bacterium]
MALFGKKARYTSVTVRKRDIPDGLWTKCPSCGEIVYRNALAEALQVCPKCQYHFPMSRAERIALLAEPNSWREWDADLRSADPLEFTGTASYREKLEENIRKTGHLDAVSCGTARIGPHEVGLGVMDFAFLGASMGSVVGEKITRLIERSTAARRAVVIVCASGGARMYEGMLSLMQMAKTSAACARHRDAGLPYIAVLTNPTTAGVMASFATLGDVIIAEPGALIGFAGPRVIRETTQQELPPGFQTAEFLLEHGLLDAVVHRRDLKTVLVRLLDYLSPAGASAPPPAQ